MSLCYRRSNIIAIILFLFILREVISILTLPVNSIEALADRLILISNRKACLELSLFKSLSFLSNSPQFANCSNLSPLLLKDSMRIAVMLYLPEIQETMAFWSLLKLKSMKQSTSTCLFCNNYCSHFPLLNY